jgi:uncharacterized protein YfiM (DUF2279 family)
MSCSVGDAYRTVVDKPSLALAVAETPVGVFGLLFFILTSMEGVKSLTGSNSILAIFKESLKGIRSFASAGISRAKDQRQELQTLEKKELGIWVLSLALTTGLFVGLANDSISWLSLTASVLLGSIFIAVISRYGSPSWLRAILGGTILGASIGITVFLIRQVDTWASRILLPDILFLLLFSYFILSGLALWNTYTPFNRSVISAKDKTDADGQRKSKEISKKKKSKKELKHDEQRDTDGVGEAP